MRVDAHHAQGTLEHSQTQGAAQKNTDERMYRVCRIKTGCTVCLSLPLHHVALRQQQLQTTSCYKRINEHNVPRNLYQQVWP